MIVSSNIVRVLVLEDDLELGEGIADGLRSAGFAVDIARDIADADLKVAINRYNCLIIDRGLPDGDGLTLVRKLRDAGRRVPMLVLTARDAVTDRVAGFEQGADDYLTKPFALTELVVRVRALCRRDDEPLPPRISVGNLSIDLPRHRARRNGILLALTPKEFAVLELLALRAGTVVSRSELIECCWDEMAEPTSNVVDVVIAQLRRKLGLPSLITTVRGTGFVLERGLPSDRGVSSVSND